MCVDCLCGCDDLFIRRIEFSVTDIVLDRAGEQEVILRDEMKFSVRRNRRSKDMAGLDIVKAADQVDDRRFACAGRTD